MCCYPSPCSPPPLPSKLAPRGIGNTSPANLVKGGRPEVVLVVGDGVGPLRMYEWVKGTWRPKTLIEHIDNGHSLDVLDFNGDGNLDIFCAEMRLNAGNPKARAYVLLGDGKGNFQTTVIAEGFGMHEAKMADLDGLRSSEKEV